MVVEYTNEIWDIIDHYIKDVVLPQSTPKDVVSTEYIHTTSPQDAERIYLVSDPAISRAEPAMIQGMGLVEGKILAFLKAEREAKTLVLIGMLGCGKTTTLRYIRDNHLSQLGAISIYIDFNSYDVDPDAASKWAESFVKSDEVFQPPDSYALRLRNELSTRLGDHISYEEELKDMWTWAMSSSMRRNDPAGVAVMDGPYRYLKSRSINPESEDATAMSHRREAYEAFAATMSGGWSAMEALEYETLKARYIVEKKLGGDGRRLVFIFDNLDTLGSGTHLAMLDFAVRAPTRARCRSIVSARPHTALPWLQGRRATHWTVIEAVEHFGPPFLEIIRFRLNKFILDLTDQELEVNLSKVFHANMAVARRSVGREPIAGTDQPRHVVLFRDLAIPFSWIREWARMTITAMGQVRDEQPDRSGRRGEAGTFLRGVMGSSVRVGYELTYKVMRSWSIPLDRLAPDPSLYRLDPVGPDGIHKPVIKSGVRLPDLLKSTGRPTGGEVVRAVLADRQPRYVWSDRRLIDNVFRCGLNRPNDVLCKPRLLSFLARQPNARANVAELQQWCNAFGIPERSVREALKQMSDDGKRMLWLDTVPAFDKPLDCWPMSVIDLSQTGKFYIEHAVRTIDYVEEVMPSSDIPVSIQVSGSRLVRRSAAMRNFARQLILIDAKQVKQFVIFSPGGLVEHYREKHGAKLMSVGLFQHWKGEFVNLLMATRGTSRQSGPDQDGASTRSDAAHSEVQEWENFMEASVEVGNRPHRTAEKLAAIVSQAEELLDSRG